MKKKTRLNHYNHYERSIFDISHSNVQEKYTAISLRTVLSTFKKTPVVMCGTPKYHLFYVFEPGNNGNDLRNVKSAQLITHCNVCMCNMIYDWLGSLL